MGILRNPVSRLLAALLLTAWISLPAAAQRGAGQSKSQPGKNPPGAMRGMLGLPPFWLERLQEMSPAEQERFLSNNERFKFLPLARQKQIRERLRQWNNLPPEQRAALRQRQRVWEKMPPEQQRRVREEILPKWQQLPAERRQILLRRLSVLRSMEEAERAAKLYDDTFLTGLTPEEQDLLRELASLRTASPPDIPQDIPPPFE